MESGGEDDTIGDSADSFVLPSDHCQIDDDPEDQPRTHLVESFDVE